ncbi:MAG: hypothetical protein MUO72_05940 [Bacteroidales bacterium]|nr:hypothetical protein [Bacteroidales bacterium]
MELSQFGNTIQTRVLKYELLILIIMILALILKIFNVPYSGLINTVVLLTIGCIYFFSAFSVPENTVLSALDGFFYKIAGLGSSVAVIGILFYIQKWPMGDTMITVGLISIIVALGYILYQNIKSPESGRFNKLLIIKILVLVLISGGVLYFGIK